MGGSRAKEAVPVQWHTGRLDSGLTLSSVLTRPINTVSEAPLASLVDINTLRSLLDGLSALLGMTTALLDLEGNILQSAGWQRACTGFHRAVAGSCANCTESDLFLVSHLQKGEFVDYKCKNGLWDVVTPVFVGNQHLGNLYCGQFFYDDDVVDEGFFVAQAERFGYDQAAYLAAIHEIPRFGRDHVRRVMALMVGLASYLSHLSLTNLKSSESRRQMEAFLNALPDPVWLKDTEGVFLACNRAFERILGAHADEIIGKTDYHFCSAELAEGFRQKDREAIAAAEPKFNEEWLTSAESRQAILLETIKTALPGLNGQAAGVLCIARDITERKQMEQLLQAREQEFRTLAENSPDVIIRYDRNCRRIYVNPAHREATGISPEQALHVPLAPGWRASVPVDEFGAHLRRTMESGQATQLFLAWPGPDGRAHDYACHMLAERNAEDRVVGALIIGRDITALRATERRLEKSEALLRQLAARQETAREDERKRIARELHDEMGQYLSALRLDISVLRMHFGASNPLLPAKLQRMTDLVDNTIRVVREVVSALRPAALDMGLVSALEWLAEQFSKRTHIKCELRVDDEGIELDEDRAVVVFRIVQESLTNVSRHAEASWVLISLRPAENHFILSIVDNGKGFDSTSCKEKAFGLIGIEERAIMLGGKLSIRSAPGGGTSIFVSLPTHSCVPGENR